MGFWNTLDSVENISTLLNWIAALAVIGALVFGARASTLREQIEIGRNQQLAAVEKQAAAPSLALSGYEINKAVNGIDLTVQFSPNKNTPLGQLLFTANIPRDSNVIIINFWPSLKGGAFLSGDNSKIIAADGKSASLRYSLMAAGSPTVLLTVSGPTIVTFDGNYGPQSIQVPVRAP